MIKIYRKTATIKAEPFDYEKWVHMRHEAYPMVFGDIAKDGGMMATNPFIKTLEGNLHISDGDWIATGVNGEHWAIADDIFKKTYAELPVIPKNVADYLEEFNRSNTTLGDVLCSAELKSWISYTPDYRFNYDSYKKRQDLIALAWLIGYQVEEYK